MVEEAPADEEAQGQTGQPETGVVLEELDEAREQGLLRRILGRIQLVWRRLRNSTQLARPVVLRPRGVRLLALLVLLNLAALISLSYALYRASAMLDTLQQPLPPPVATDAVPSFLPTPGPTATPFGSGGAIAFTLRRDGNADIYALNQTERQLVRLTHDAAEDREPTWSPDGDYLAFASNRAHNWDIYLLDLASGALIRLTHDAGYDANPSWSPDGKWIAFESCRYGGNLDIFVMSTTGQRVRRITRDSAPDYGPTWSPDSRAIAFTSFREGTKDIYLAFLDGEDAPINVTQSPDVDEADPAWSADGTQLAHASGPRGNASIQVTTFDPETLTANQAETELFGAGISPAWSPDEQSLIYAYERGGRSHLVAASLTGWALFHEVYSVEGEVDDLAWTSEKLPQRVIAQAQSAEPEPLSLYLELVQPTPPSAPPYELVSLPGMAGGSQMQLSDRVNESFNALRKRVIEEVGWDYLGDLVTAAQPLTFTPPSGQSRMRWHLCGRAVGLDQDPYEVDDPNVELMREDVGSTTYWRVFVRAAKQDGSMGEPLREPPWDLNARQESGRAMVEGGAPKAEIPPGYYVDLTTLARSYGWERVPSLWRWRYFWSDIRWWELQKADGLTWWACMLEIYEPSRIERYFGPIPGYEE